MGIHDREYYRDETSGSGWFSGVAPVTQALILTNVAVFLLRWIFPQWHLADYLAAQPDAIFERGWVWQLLTAAFYHEEPLHILFNMLVLWWVGRELESMYGSREFLRFYLAAAVLSMLCWAVIDDFALSRGQAVAMGASGAVTAAFVLYAMYYPRREVLLFFVLPMPIWLMCVLFLGLDLLWLIQEFQGQRSAGVAFAAHLGGAAYGYLYKRFDLRWSRLLGGRTFRPRLRMVMPEARERGSYAPPTSIRSPSAGTPSSRPAPTVVFPPEQLDARLDEILAKIASEGRGSLTEEENQILQEASRRARDRRSERIR
jgi:membrane associated rhomboid family serine protease